MFAFARKKRINHYLQGVGTYVSYTYVLESKKVDTPTEVRNDPTDTDNDNGVKYSLQFPCRFSRELVGIPKQGDSFHANAVSHLLTQFTTNSEYVNSELEATLNLSFTDMLMRYINMKGALLFSILNIIQLIGWTAIMIYDSALAVNGIFDIGNWLWCIVIGALIILWILVGIQHLGKLNAVAMSALFVLTIVLSFVIFGEGNVLNISGDGMTFGAAVELSVAMPLSWLPLISDYTCKAKKPVKATAVSAITYGIVSCWMYIIGMGAAIFTAESDIAQIMVKAGLGIAGLLIVVFSTVTTTFLDAYSAGVSSESLSKKINSKWIAVAVTVIGTLGAIYLPLYDITDFLYFIGSVFAPMIAIQIADFFILKKSKENQAFCFQNLILWFFGFVIYRLLMQVDIIVGNTLPDMVITVILCVLVSKIGSTKKMPNV